MIYELFLHEIKCNVNNTTWNDKHYICDFISAVDGVWSDYMAWTAWSTCNKSFGMGTRTRTRTRLCNDPAPRHDGNPCAGSDTETESESCKGLECTGTIQMKIISTIGNFVRAKQKENQNFFKEDRLPDMWDKSFLKMHRVTNDNTEYKCQGPASGCNPTLPLWAMSLTSLSKIPV